MKNKKIIMLVSVIVLLLITFLITIKNNRSYSLDPTDANITEADLEVGRNGIIKEMVLISRVSGTSPFDDNNNPGNDHNADNSIVRSFDTVSWTIESTFGLKDNTNTTPYSGGVLEINATIPGVLNNYVKWDLESMGWAQNATISDDGVTFKGYYFLDKNNITIPGGKQTINLVLNVLGSPNGFELKPFVTMKFAGNEESEKVSDTIDTVTVSSAPKYNIRLVNNANWFNNRMKLNFGSGEKTGRLYSFNYVLELYNDSEDKELKGIEYPKGNISFDLDLKLERQIEGSNLLEDITNDSTPLLWAYNYNNVPTSLVPGRSVTFEGNKYSHYNPYLPIGTIVDNWRLKEVLNSGNISMVQNGKTINVNISDYSIDGIFPKCPIADACTKNNYNSYANRVKKNTGPISVINYLLFVPENEATLVAPANYYLTITDKNFVSKSISDQNATTQMVDTDDNLRVQHRTFNPGKYDQYIVPYSKTGSKLWATHAGGESKAMINDNFYIDYYSAVDSNNDYDVLSATKFIRFDGSCFKPMYFENNEKWRKGEGYGDMTLNVYYLTKADGTNWVNDTEMNQAKIEDMVYYERIEDVPSNHIIVGEYFETLDGKFNKDYNGVILPYIVKDTAEINKVCQVVQTTKMWTSNVDRNQYSITKGNFSSWPDAEYDSGYTNYIKTEYDENGNVKSGTHSNGNYLYGQSIQVVGADLSVVKEIIEKTSDNKEKINYDLGKSELDVKFRIVPGLISSAVDSDTIKGVNLKITEHIPNGLSYVPGSSTYSDPEITNNGDGSQTLVWYIYNQTVNKTIPSIDYIAHIDINSQNAKQYETKTVIEEIPTGGIYKIGNSHISSRSALKGIQIINLANYSLFKQVETPVIEKNGTGLYKITVMNNTDKDVNNFQLLDILPYNNDDRGSKYDGNYTVEKITMSSTNNKTLYVTDSVAVRSMNAKDTGIGVSNIWQSVTSGSTINRSLSGFSIKGILNASERLEIEIHIKTQGNKEDDKYINNTTVQTNPLTEVMTSSNVKIEVVRRMISGYVWADKNGNGLIDSGEKYLNNIELELLNEQKEIISRTRTNTDGYYEFNNLAKGKYYVGISFGNKYVMTSKEVGTNNEINSKFNETDETDIINNLDTLIRPLTIAKYQNAGLVTKKGLYTINYLDKDTKEKVAPSKEDMEEEYDVIINYIDHKKDVEGYNYDSVDKETVTIGPEKRVINIYYTKKKYTYKVNYLDKETKEKIEISKIEEGHKGEIIKSADEIKEIPTYEYDSYDKESITISEQLQEINLYYIRKKNIVVVRYVDIDTDKDIIDYIEKKDKIGAPYRTEKREFDKYVFIKDTGNTEGVYTTEAIEVIYYYKKVKYKVETEVINGVIDPSVEALPDENVRITYKENSGYKLISIEVDGKEVDISKYPTEYEFKKINNNHKIKVVYEKENNTPNIITSNTPKTIDDIFTYVFLFGGSIIIIMLIIIALNKNKKKGDK